MEHTSIGNEDLEVSRIGLGTWAIGGWMWGGTDEADAVRTIHAALERGITLIDTAPVYGFGQSERTVGKALATSPLRSRAVVATKCGLEWNDAEEIRRNSSPERLRREVEDSLRRLGTDVIHLQQVHWPDASVPFERTAETLEELRREGKIVAIGVSNYSPGQMDSFRRGAELASDQPPYNLFERGIEDDVLPYCREHDVAVLAYGALCRGLLTGKMREDTSFSGDDLRRNDPKFAEPRFTQYLEAVSRLDALARERFDRSVLELAVRWLLDRPGVSVALWGARRPDQLDAIEGVMGWTLDDETSDDIDRILSETISDPVGPEFMAPPENPSA